MLFLKTAFPVVLKFWLGRNYAENLSTSTHNRNRTGRRKGSPCSWKSIGSPYHATVISRVKRQDTTRRNFRQRSIFQHRQHRRVPIDTYYAGENVSPPRATQPKASCLFEAVEGPWWRASPANGPLSRRPSFGREDLRRSEAFCPRDY